MTKEKANKVYDILVDVGKAAESMRKSFVFHHTESEYGCNEWRFQGLLGYGGKYRSERNTVDCYSENLDKATTKIIDQINSELSKL